MTASARFADFDLPPDTRQCAISLDTLVDGVHFTARTPAAVVGYKSLAVNLSDLAAMGATALAAHVAWSDPHDERQWQDEMTTALQQAADENNMTLHSLRVHAARRQISVQIVGAVSAEGALRRDGARPGDQVWVSGTLGDAGAGLALSQQQGVTSAHGHENDGDWLLQRFHYPQARLALGRALCGIATAAIDVSDGIVGDAAHIASRSALGIRIIANQLPLSAALRRVMGDVRAMQLALAAGEDYELLFTAAAQAAPRVRAAAHSAGVAVCCIGSVVAGNGVSLLDAAGRSLPMPRAFDHFAHRADDDGPLPDGPHR